MSTETIRVGALIRRHMRVVLDQEGLEWTEYKGLLDSVFVARGSADQFAIISRRFEKFL